MNTEKSQGRSLQMIQGEKLTTFSAMEELPTISEPEKLCVLLKEGREKYNLKQKDIAERLGITPTVVNRIEAGTTTKPSERVLKGIAPYTGKGYSELLFIAGYSRIIDKEIFFNAEGEEIPYLEIVRDIYDADFELLETLKGLQSLSYNHINILKKLICVMKLAENTDINNSIVDKKENTGMKLFHSTLRFLFDQLETIINLLTPASTTN